MTKIRDLTPRKSGDSMKVIIEKLNSSLRSWFNYFRHCFWNIFKGLRQPCACRVVPFNAFKDYWSFIQKLMLPQQVRHHRAPGS